MCFTKRSLNGGCVVFFGGPTRETDLPGVLGKVIRSAGQYHFGYLKIQQRHEDGRGFTRPEWFISGWAIPAYMKVLHARFQGRNGLQQLFTPMFHHENKAPK